MKRGFEFSFTWLFVIVVGATILILAVFMASRLINREANIYNTEVAAELGATLTPIETSIESGKYYPLVFPAETRLSNECDSAGTFGEQELAVSVSSRVGETWSSAGIPYRTSRAFIFSPEDFQSKQAHVISNAIELPYAVGNALVLYAETYCFVEPPEELEDTLTALSAPGMEVVRTRGACAAESITVCFSGSGCDIQVQATTAQTGLVRKNGQTISYFNGLFYAALVSEKSLYDCQITRIRKRAGELAQLYAEKSTFLDARGCTNSLTGALSLYRERLLSTSTDLSSLVNDAEALRQSNDRLACKLF